MENIKIFTRAGKAYDYNAEFEHPDTGCDFDYGVIYGGSEVENTVDILLPLFRDLWERRGHYYHEVKVTIVAYYEIDDTIYRCESSVKGGWYESNEDIAASFEERCTKWKMD